MLQASFPSLPLPLQSARRSSDSIHILSSFVLLQNLHYRCARTELVTIHSWRRESIFPPLASISLNGLNPVFFFLPQYNQNLQFPLRGKAMMWGIQGIGGLAIRELTISSLPPLPRTDLFLLLLRLSVFYGYDQGVMSGVNNNPVYRVSFRSFSSTTVNDETKSEVFEAHHLSSSARGWFGRTEDHGSQLTCRDWT